MADSSADKTEKATPKRERKAREEGQVPRSRELASLVVVGMGVVTLMMLSSLLAGWSNTWMQRALMPDIHHLLDHPMDMPRYFGLMMLGGFVIAAPLLVVGWLAALVPPTLLGGWNFSTQAMMPKFSKLDPIAGIKRMFSLQSLVELGKTVLKVLLLGTIAVIYFRTHLDQIMALGRQPIVPAMANGLGILLGCLAWMLIGLLLVALVDAPYQLWSHAKKLRMTKQEVKQEYKETEGSPEIKGRQRQLAQQMAQQQMMEAVPGADVIVVNPTHYAVALKYDPEKMRAPKVLAKGVDFLAQNIRNLGREHKIPILSAPPLARALYRSTQVNDEIPADLYAAVAQVLTYIYQLRDWRQKTGAAGARPTLPRIADVPGGEPDP